MGIALALNVVNDSTLATTAREITAGGDVTFAAHASASTLAGAKASAAGAEEETEAAEKATAAPRKSLIDTKVIADDNTINLGAGHGFKTGDAVVYKQG